MQRTPRSHSPPESHEDPSAASSPPYANTTMPGRGGRTTASMVGSRGGRRQVRARVLKRTNSGNSVGSPTGTVASGFPRVPTGGMRTPSPSHHGTEPHEHHSTHSHSSGDLSTHAHLEPLREEEEQLPRLRQQVIQLPKLREDEVEEPSKPSPQPRRAAEPKTQPPTPEQLALARVQLTVPPKAELRAAASRLPHPERHRRLVAAGSSNPLHVWGHETSFVKSHYFSAKRRDDEKKYRVQKDQAERLFGDAATPPTVGAWSQESSLLSGSQRVPLKPLGGAAGDGGGGGGGDGNNDSGGKGYFGNSSTSETTPLTSETWISANHCRTRNMNALHAFSWDQRVFLPQRRGFFSTWFDLLASPRLWEKLDWSIRGAIFTVLPTMVLCVEPTTRHIFPLPSSVVFMAFWTTQPTLGAGLREIFTFFKGFIISFIFMLIVVAIDPGPKWLKLIILFFSMLTLGFVAETIKRMLAFCFASMLMQYITSPETTGYKYIGDYFSTILIGQAIGFASFMFPYIRWSSENARRYLVITGDAISLSVHGACVSFWVENSLLERQLHVARLRQLRQTIEASMQKTRQAISEMGYEPHSGLYTSRIKTRMALLQDVFNVVQSMTLVIEQVAANPALVETAMCREFGRRIRGELGLAGAAMDTMLLRIVDLESLVSVADMEAFRLAKARYEDAVSTVRDEVILGNPDYRTDNSDILLGFFLFSVEELMGIISSFQDPEKPPSNLWYLVTFPLRDVQSSWGAIVDLYNAIRIRRSITRRLKESFKLSVSTIVAAIFQTYAMGNSTTSVTAGVEIIAFVYRGTGGESFQYATQRLQGTVLGSLLGLMCVQLANGYRPTLYGCAIVVIFAGAYVQTSPEYNALGNALANSVVAIVISYTNQDAAMTRIQQTCFAILIYFAVSSFVWPVRGKTKVNTGLDVSLRMAREATDRLLCNLDLPDSATAVSADVLAVLGEMQKKVGQQVTYIPSAVDEPTFDSAPFPEMPWHMLITSQRKLMVTLYMMRHAYLTFMTSTIADKVGDEESAKTMQDNAAMAGMGPAAATSISVHWVVLHRISPYTRQLSHLFYEAIEVYLLTLSKATFVPTAELNRLRLGMMQLYDRIVATYIDTIQHELNESDDDVGDLSDASDGFPNESGSRAGTGKKKGGNNNTRGGGAGALSVEGAAGFMPPAASTFAPSPTTVGGAADSGTGNANSHSNVNPNSFARTLGSGSRTHRTHGGTSRSGGTSGGKGAGRFSYKLTPAERQRLREYVLGPNAVGQTNASFFANAAAMAAAAEAVRANASATMRAAGASTNTNPAAVGTTASNNAQQAGNTAGGPVTNQSMFNMNESMWRRNMSMFNTSGSFWNRNVSMFDPALLRNAGIVVQEPVHVEPHQEHRDEVMSAAGSRRPSMLRNYSLARGSDGARAMHTSSTGMRGITTDLDDPNRPGEGGRGAAAVPPPLENEDERNNNNAGSGNLDGTQDNMSTGPWSPLPAEPARHEPSMLSAMTTMPRGIMKKSKTSKYAKPSMLQASVVTPATAAAVAVAAAEAAEAEEQANRDPRAHSASVLVPTFHNSRRDNAGGNSQTDRNNVSGSRGPLPGAASSSLLGQSHSTNQSQSFVSGGAGSMGPTGGDIFSLGHTARPSVRPTTRWSMAGMRGANHHQHRRSASKGEDGDPIWRAEQGGFDEDDVDRPRPRRAPSRHDLDVVIEEDGEEGEGHRSVGPSISATAAPSMSPRPEGATVAGTERDARRSPQSSHEPFEEDRDTAAPDAGEARERQSDRAAARHGSGSSQGTGRQGNFLSSATDDHVDIEGADNLLSDTLQQQLDGTTVTVAHSTAAPNLLPTPIPAPGGLEGPTRMNASATRRVGNNSFTAAGAPAIPEALRAYVEGLVEHQQQQAPPPPALLGNMSFINLSANLPVPNRSFFSGMGNTAGNTMGNSGNDNEGSHATAGCMPPDPAANSATASPPMDAASAASAGAINATLQADFMSAISNLQFNNSTFAGTFRGSDDATTAGGHGLLALLEPNPDMGCDEDGADEYVLTNSDIHSLEAFLFGLRALITQVEDLERHLLEMVHGNEMSTKL